MLLSLCSVDKNFKKYACQKKKKKVPEKNDFSKACGIFTIASGLIIN
jgi:hypothetical protein